MYVKFQLTNLCEEVTTMKFSEVKSLFLVEFGKMGMSAYELRNTWLTFAEDLFSSGEINQRVYMRCQEV